jgi:hypothetical protein
MKRLVSLLDGADARIQRLNVAGNEGLTASSLNQVVALPGLRDLDVSHCLLSDNDLLVLSQCLTEPRTTLERLVLHGLPSGTRETYRALGSAAHGLTDLIVSYQNTSSDDQDASTASGDALITGLRDAVRSDRNTQMQLKQLWMEGLQVTRAGVEALVEVLEQRTLQQLHLAKAQLTPSELLPLLDYDGDQPLSLFSLDLRGNPLGFDLGALLNTKGVCGCTELTLLGCGLSELSTSDCRWPYLAKLDLACNALTDTDMLEQLVNALEDRQRFPKLAQVCLGGQAGSVEGKEDAVKDLIKRTRTGTIEYIV